MHPGGVHPLRPMPNNNRSAAGQRPIMQAIRSKDTKPELRVRSMLHKLGYRFRIHRKNLPGKPDIALTARPQGHLRARLLLARP